MKVLLGFLIVCVLLLAWAAWQVRDVRQAGPAAAPPSVAPPAIAEDRSGPEAEDLANPRAAELASTALATPDDVPAESQTVTGLVQWALPAGHADALRTVALTQEILRTEPHHVDALRDQAHALLVLRRWTEAGNVLARYLALQPEDVALRYELAAACMRQQRWTDALAQWRLLVEQTPDDARTWFNLAVAHQALGHLADARQAWNAVLRRAPSPAAYARRGEVLLDLEEWAAAADDFERVLAEQLGAEDALLNCCLALRRCGRAFEAAERLRAFVAARPGHVPAWNSLAETACEIARTEADGAAWQAEAERCWAASLALDQSQDAIRARLEAARGAR